MTPKMASITNSDGSKIYKSEIGQSELVNAREWFSAKVQGNRFFPTHTINNHERSREGKNNETQNKFAR